MRNYQPRLIVFLLVLFLFLALLVPGPEWASIHPAQANTLTVNSIADDSTTCGVSGTVCLRNATTCSTADSVFQYGPATSNVGAPATPVTGRWVGQINTTIGVYVPANAYFYLKNTNAAGNADNQFQYGPGPNAGWLPVFGHWASPGPHISGAATAKLTGALGFISNRDGQWGDLYPPER